MHRDVDEASHRDGVLSCPRATRAKVAADTARPRRGLHCRGLLSRDFLSRQIADTSRGGRRTGSRWVDRWGFCGSLSVGPRRPSWLDGDGTLSLCYVAHPREATLVHPSKTPT